MFEYFNSIKNAVKNLLFIFDVAFIFSYEYLRYFITRDYVNFIRNVAKQLSKKNILYVKMFQAISLNNNLIDDTINGELLKYTDSAPYTQDDINEDLIRLIKN